MWFERFLRRIEASSIGGVLEKRLRLLRYGDNPGRIYVENVRAFFGVTTRIATALCELAVREGYFDRCTAVMCPNDDRILFEDCEDDATGVPDRVICEVCEALENEPFEFPIDDCHTLPFYRMHRESTEGRLTHA